MKKIKRFRMILQALFIGLSMISCSVTNENSERTKPNILLITSEDNGPHLSCYGDPFCKTPNLDKLASEGILFLSAYVTQAGCSQSRASIFTGLYPHQHGQIGLATHNLQMYHDSFPNIFSELKSIGYSTGIIGKIHVNPESSFPLDYHSPIRGGFNNRDVEAVADTAYHFISSTSEPFILMVNYTDAHRPFIKQSEGLPEDPLEIGDVKVLPEIGIETEFITEQTANYFNCIMRLDAGLGMLIKKLDESGKGKNTFVIYLGDHGQDILRGKRTSYEGGTKVPLIIYCPGEILSRQRNKPFQGRVVNELVSTIDLLPTLLELSGIDKTEELLGKSLMPFFNGKNPEWRKYLFTEFHLHSGHNFYPQRTVRNARYKLIYNLMPGEINLGYQYTLDRFIDIEEFNQKVENSPQYIRNTYRILKQPPEYELYDLERDPCEFHNLAQDSTYGEVLHELIKELQKWQEQTNDPLRYDENLLKLKAEVDSCWSTCKYIKKDKWYYPVYFFNNE